ncbi:MAG: hypothetical protein ABI743_02945 [bacterium]
MSRRCFIASLLLAFATLAAVLMGGCVKQDPLNDVVLTKVKEDLKANYNPGIDAIILKTEFVKDTLKVWIADDFKAEDVEKFTKVLATTYGHIARKEGKIASDYEVHVFQKQHNATTGDDKVYNISAGTFHNGKEITDVQLFGQGDGKYDYQ